MKKLLLYGITTCTALFAACSSDEKDQPAMPAPTPAEQNGVEFIPYLSELSRATDTRFESGDAISVWAVKAVNGAAGSLKNGSGNYANNVRFNYNGTRFVAHSTPIEKADAEKLNYFAVYPYATTNSSRFTFRVKNDQTSRANYTLSDLCLARTSVMASKTVELSFSHALAQLIIDVDASLGNVTGVELPNIATSAIIDINNWSIDSTSGTVGSVKMSPNGTRSYRAVIPIQKIYKDYELAIVHTTSGDYKWAIEQTTEFRSGCSYSYTLKATSSGTVSFGGTITPWETN